MMAPSAPPTKRRSRRKEARPAEILKAALALFAERGYAATKLEDVAAAAGIAKGTVYLYFPTKEELFKAVVRQELLPNLDRFEALVRSHTGPAAELLRLFSGRWLQLFDTDLTAIPKLVITEAGNFPAIARFYADEVVKRGMALVGSIIVRGIEDGEFRRIDPVIVLPLVVAPFLMMALFKHSLRPHTDVAFDARAVLEAHMDVLLRGLAAEIPE